MQGWAAAGEDPLGYQADVVIVNRLQTAFALMRRGVKRVICYIGHSLLHDCFQCSMLQFILIYAFDTFS